MNSCQIPIKMLPAFFTLILFLLINFSGTSFVCPSSCYCDDKGEYVSCVGDGLWRFPEDIPNSTIRLELRNYLVNELLPQDLCDLVVLEELKLQQSHIEIVDNATFSSNTKLEGLDLSQNSLTSLSSSIFTDLSRLRHLDLSSNFIEFMEGAFIDLLNLEQLNLRDNRLPQLTTRSFVGLHKIQYLNLDANNISTIEVGTFQYLTNLAHLIISNNPLTTLSRLDFFGSRLQYIDISHVGLDRVPQSLTKFVRDLRLAKNNLTHISAGDFDSYPYLGLLVLDDNCVSEIENDALGRQEYLMRLWLNGNCLTKVPPNLPPSLLALYMEENKLTSLTSFSFKGLVHLEQLFLQRNEIQDLFPCAFCDLVNLKSLDLQANQIENLTAGVFSNLTQLETLDLSQNNLKIMDARCFDGLARLITLQMSRVHSSVQMDEAMFDPLHNLQTLEVYDSSLLVHTILNSTRMLHGLRKVQELNIMHNRIVKLRADFSSFFPSLKLIKMSGNLWNCDQDIKWLVNWIKQSNVQFYSSFNIRCASPESVVFKPLMMLTDGDFTTESTSVYTSEATTSSSTTQLIETPTLVEHVSIVFKNISSVSLSVSTSSESSSASTTEEIASSTEQTTHDKKISDNSKSTTPYMHPSSEPTNNDTVYNATPSSVTSTSVLTTKQQVITTNIPTKISISTEDTLKQSPSLTSPAARKSFNVTAFARRSNSSFTHTYSLLSQQGMKINKDPRTDRVFFIFFGTVAALLLFCALGALIICKCRHPYQPVKQRRSSISYYPQKDEVSIVTLTEGTIGLRTNSHHGLGNKLYYIMENDTPNPDRDTPSDSQLQELLPQSPTEQNRLY
ncbi:leucine-rich repeats and immunoglobulin-like domains protein 1 [Argiope bruennichi]|uniref:leucine-rich repeats and immunoglobulin-like domains protein 1 n=1 Tax=Argiope bruennichi TaxID=94029 RepID=UPI002494FF19|nr:leucine-rich repeats and immunoglobulin-like domains protein 1 [Argiope bruennichi]